MTPVVVTPPASQPVTLAEAKAQCRVDIADDDTYLNGLIAAAARHVDRFTGRSILTQTLRLGVPEFADQIRLPRGPVQSVVSVAYYDKEGVDRTLTTGWALDGTRDPARIVKDADAVWPLTQERFDAVRITYVAGYPANSPDLPPLKHAMLLLIGHWYGNREAVGPSMPALELAVDALLANYRAYNL